MNIFKITFILLLLVPVTSIAQDSNKYDSLDNLSSKRFIPVYRVNIGSSITYFQKGVTGSNFFITPSFSMPITKKFSFEGGLIASINNLPGFPLNENFPTQRFNNLSVFGSTIYQVSPRLMIYATGIKQISNTPLPTHFSNIPQNSFNFGSSLKLGKGLTIGASIHMSNYYNLYSPIPFGLHDNLPIMW